MNPSPPESQSDMQNRYTLGTIELFTYRPGIGSPGSPRLMRGVSLQHLHLVTELVSVEGLEPPAPCFQNRTSAADLHTDENCM